ncbi:cupin domain-containing protein [Streptomyces parvus]|uniref:zf-HC2 domain-containing protein n=1 Tax=Streptomyces parvus TaxID=66428 RepID=UPI0034035065
MSKEHASPNIITAYARGDTALPADVLWAVESHLEACADCRRLLSEAVTDQAPDVAALTRSVWTGLAAELAAPATGARQRLGRTRRARWLTPAMVPWLATAVGLTGIALLLDLAGRRSGEVSPVLLIAPLLPVLGVAVSWSRGTDPAYELTASTPLAGLPLVLRRTAAVLAVVVPVLWASGWATGAGAAQWLLPCLGFTTLTLALGTVMTVSRAAVLLSALWAAVIAVPALATGRTAYLLTSTGLPLWAGVLVLSCGVVIGRRNTYTRLGTGQ